MQDGKCTMHKIKPHLDMAWSPPAGMLSTLPATLMFPSQEADTGQKQMKQFSSCLFSGQLWTRFHQGFSGLESSFVSTSSSIMMTFLPKKSSTQRNLHCLPPFHNDIHFLVLPTLVLESGHDTIRLGSALLPEQNASCDGRNYWITTECEASEGVTSDDKSLCGCHSPGKDFFWLYGWCGWMWILPSFLLGEDKPGGWEETHVKNTEHTNRKPRTYCLHGWT